MKVQTLIRIAEKRYGWWNNWPSECGVPGHTSSNLCDCQLPKNWVFCYDVHEIYNKLSKY